MEPIIAAATEYNIHSYSPFLIKFSESFGIRYYGLSYVLGFLSGLWLLARYHKNGLSPFDADQRTDIFFTLMVGVIVGGRLGFFLFYQSASLVQDPLALFRVWEGGMASHGGFIGVAGATWWTARKYKVSFWQVADLFCSLSPAGLLLGRLANFMNGELWGKVTDVSWAWIFPKDPTGLPRHPSQLYEAGLEGFFMLLYSQWRIWFTPVLKDAPGRLVGEFLFLYAIVRIIGEQYREPDEGIELLFGMMSRGTTLSIAMAIVGLLIALTRSKTKKSSTS
ncbi:prolipoprotein diacylglyceryl transferase [Puniceicoccaceae bacterium K14]|nr:prolipoprotein diacylglyceryl transferase [Puniceicoccaceae bacterium K14]